MRGLRSLAAVVAAAMCFVSVSCENVEFMEAVNDSLIAAEFSHFDNKPKRAIGEVYAQKGEKITTVWNNPRNTRYDVSLSGADAYAVEDAWQSDENRGIVYIKIKEEISEEEGLNITLHLTPLKGEIKSLPAPLSIRVVFRDDNEEEEEEDTGEWPLGIRVLKPGEKLSDIVGNMGSGGTIGIPSGMPSLTESVEITGDMNLTIKGDGETVIKAGFDNAPLFKVEAGASLTLENITLDGGAIWKYGTATPPSPAFGASNDTAAGGRVATAPLVKVGTGSTLTLGAKAVIKNNDYQGSGNGGGVAVEAGGTLIMNSRTARIEYNRSAGKGGGVYVDGARFELIKGSINNNHALSDGGGVVIVQNAAFTMSSGTIKDNAAVGYGGGVYLQISTANFTMAGGTISANTAGQGGGVFNNGTIVMSGSAKVNTDNDVFLNNGTKIKIGSSGLSGTGTVAMITPSSYTAGTTPQVLDGSFDGYTHRFTLSNDGWYIYHVDGKIQDTKAAKRTVGGIDYFYPTLAKAIEKATGTSTSQETVTLLEDVGATANILLSGKHIKLNGGGKTIKRTSGFGGAFFSVYGSLTLENITLDGGAVWTGGTSFPPSPAFGAANSGIGASSPLVVVTGDTATLTLKDNAVLKNNNSTLYGCGVRVENSGTLIMNSDTAEIAYNSVSDYSVGGGVNLDNGSFELSKGRIHNNYQSFTNGGGVLIGSSSTFTMSGGTISANKANRVGGGVYNNGGAFTMKGGTIGLNIAATYGGGVYNNGGAFTMEGGTIGLNTAANYGNGVYHAGNTFTMKGSAVVNTNNDVYLARNEVITVIDLSSGTGTVAMITPYSYTAGTQILDGTEIAANNTRFDVTGFGTDCIDTAGRLVVLPFMIWLGQGSASGAPYNSDTGTFVIPTGLKAKVFLVGGGGSGAGGNGAETMGGGKGGSVVEVQNCSAGTYVWSIGQGGLGVGTGSGCVNGNSGSPTTFVSSSTSYTASGGTGGVKTGDLGTPFAQVADGTPLPQSFLSYIPDWTFNNFPLKTSLYGADGGSIRYEGNWNSLAGTTGGGINRMPGTFFGAGGGAAQGASTSGAGFRGVILIYLESAQ